MNTIFKIYTTSWALLHIAAFYLIACFINFRGWSMKTRMSLLPAGVLGCAIMLLFFANTIEIRMNDSDRDIEPIAHGLSKPEKLFPGSSGAILFLENQPQGVVLEGQGNAYSYTSFISSLAGQTAYLGWSNHIGLLTKKYEEITRREKATEQIYTESSCAKRLETVKEEGIDYVVVGDLERQKYDKVDETGAKTFAVDAQDYSCFKKLFESKHYTIFGL